MNNEQLLLPVYAPTGKTREISLDTTLLESQAKPAMIAQVIRVMLAREHQSTVSTKTRAEVSGGGRKPWKQKGTGRARQGSIRSPQWVGGGIVHGPRGDKRVLEIPKTWNKKALVSLLKKAIEEHAFVIVEDFKFEKPRTKDVLQVLSHIPDAGKILLIVDQADTHLLLSTRNLAHVEVTNLANLNVTKLLRADTIASTETTFGHVKTFLEGTHGK